MEQGLKGLLSGTGVFCWMLALMVLASCAPEKAEVAEVEQYSIHGDTVVIPDGSPLIGRIKTKILQNELYRISVTTPAQLEPNLTRLARITPPFEGRILDIFGHIGEEVNEGQALFSMSSPTLAESQKVLLEARHNLNLAENELKRQQDLINNGVGIDRDLEQAKRDQAIQHDEYLKSINVLKSYGVSPDQELGKPMIVRSPIGGNIISVALVKGEYKTDLSKPVFEVYDPTSLWITANLKEKDLRYVHEGDRSNATVVAYPDDVFEGKVFHIDEKVESETRTIKVLMEFENRHNMLKPGMFATVNFNDKPQQAILIPAKSILLENDLQMVYVKIGKGKFIRRIIQTGNSLGERVHVIGGLSVGEEITTDGSFYLINAQPVK